MTYDKTTKNKILAYATAHNISAASVKFELSRSTIQKWFKESQPNYVKAERKPFFHKLDPQLLESYVLEHPHLTCFQYGEYFGVSAVAIFNALRKLGFSFKKRNFSTKNEMKLNEQNIKKR